MAGKHRRAWSWQRPAKECSRPDWDAVHQRQAPCAQPLVPLVPLVGGVMYQPPLSPTAPPRAARQQPAVGLLWAVRPPGGEPAEPFGKASAVGRTLAGVGPTRSPRGLAAESDGRLGGGTQVAGAHFGSSAARVGSSACRRRAVSCDFLHHHAQPVSEGKIMRTTTTWAMKCGSPQLVHNS